MNRIKQIIQEEIFNLKEVRYIIPPSYDFRSSRATDIDTNTPLKDDETIVVYHGFNRFNEALLAAKFGLSGKERAQRIYSYETVNNPNGLFVTVSFFIAKEFAGGGAIVEFATKVSDLEAPVWAGKGSYFVQGEYTGSFKSPEEREQQRLNYRQQHAQSQYPAISQSDRPELAYSLFDTKERQALFTGDLNPNMIRAFWVNEKLKNERLTNGTWERISPREFVKRYYNEEAFDEYIHTFKGSEKRRSEKFYSKEGKAFQPADDFSDEKFKNFIEDKGYDYTEFIQHYVQNWDDYIMNNLLYPKQIEQIKKFYLVGKDVGAIVQEEIANHFKLKTNLSEIGEGNIQPYQWRDSGEDSLRTYYQFDTDNGLHYQVTFGKKSDWEDNLRWRVDFQAWEIPKKRGIFQRKEKNPERVEYNDTSTNRGEPLKIMSTIAEIVKDFAIKKHPHALEIHPAKEKGESDERRFRMYQAFIEKNLPPEYKVERYNNGESLLVHRYDIQEQKKPDYRGWHEAPSKAYGSPLHDMTMMYGEDIYTPNAERYFGERRPIDKYTIQIIQAYRNKPNQLVKIYRAVPKNVNTINAGDWVTIHPEYAKEHGEAHIGEGEYKVISLSVPAKNIINGGESIHEWGYSP